MSSKPSIHHMDTSYRASHGKAPRGRGSWAFSLEAMTPNGETTTLNECWFAPGNLTLNDARKKAAQYGLDIVDARGALHLVETIYIDVLS